MRKRKKNKTVVFVPGFLGCELVRKDPGDKEPVKIWSDELQVIEKCIFDDSHRESLRYRPAVQLTPTRPLDAISYFPIYKKLLTNLALDGAKKKYDLRVFSYDWRKDLSANAISLGIFLERISGEVKLVGHSLGALVCRCYLSEKAASVKLSQKMRRRISHLVELAPPHGGAPKSLLAVFNLSILLPKAVSLYLLSQRLTNPRRLFSYDSDLLLFSEVVKSFPSIYDLMAFSGDQDYDSFLEDHTSSRPCTPYNIRRWRGWTEADIQRLDSALKMRDWLLSSTFDLRISTLVGNGIAQTHYRYYVEDFPPYRPFKPSHGDGDGTVPIYSSKLNTSDVVSFRGVSHSRIVDHPKVLEWLSQNL